MPARIRPGNEPVRQPREAVRGLPGSPHQPEFYRKLRKELILANVGPCKKSIKIRGIVGGRKESLAINWKIRSWPRTVSLWSLIASIAIPAMMFLLVFVLTLAGVLT
ncbi:MAG: hypothetical protein NT069_13235 [Planctomycetota bacterium]|nr:hypothetical protein [Planctomycetota bacterium]